MKISITAHRLAWLAFSLLVGVGAITPVLSAQSSISPWLAADPDYTKIGDLNAADLTQSMTSSRDCQLRKIITKPGRLLPIHQNEQSQMACVTDTPYGSVSTNSLMQRPGSSLYGSVKSHVGGTVNLRPIPYSNTGLVLSGGSLYGSYIFFHDNLDAGLTSSAGINGEVTHRLPPITPTALNDKAGNALLGNAASMSFSSNGVWMVLDIPYIATVRVNTITREVLPFGSSVNYGIGLGPAFSTAISADGRYAAISSANFRQFKIYDLSTCGPVPDKITGKVPCNFREMLPQMEQTIQGFGNVLGIRFGDAHTLDFYASSVLPGSPATQYSRHLLTAFGQQTAGFQYLALGDSFASGEGAYQYKAITDTQQNKCHLSQRSYPFLISSELSFGQYESVACSGARMKDITSFLDGYTEEHAQAKGKSSSLYDEEILTNFLPGYREQINFSARHNPRILTLSMVGNDIGFSDKIKRCLDTDTCYSSYEDRLEIANEVNAQFYRLTGVYEELRKSGRPDMRMYVIGYPQIGDRYGNCAVNVHLNQKELTFAQQLITYLNQMIKTAAANQGVYYVDVEDAFAGHRLCETASWNVAVNGLTAGSDVVDWMFIHGPIGNESYHPNALGHQLLKTAILAKTNNLTAPMPLPNPNAHFPDPTLDPDLLNAPKSNRPIKLIRKVTGTNGGIMQIGINSYMKVTGIGNILKAKSNVQAWLHSTPTNLGTFTPDSHGDVNLNVTLPDSVTPGWHTLHLYGKNTSDEDVDFYMTVFVTDGAATPCVPTTEDTDKDGTPDTCDGHIDQAPPEPEPEPSNSNKPSGEKPAENNPETVAGNESTVAIATGSAVAPETIANTPASTTQPATPGTSHSGPTPPPAGHVAAATTTKTVHNQPETRKNSQNSQKFNNLLLIFLAMGLSGLIIRKLYFT